MWHSSSFHLLRGVNSALCECQELAVPLAKKGPRDKTPEEIKLHLYSETPDLLKEQCTKERIGNLRSAHMLQELLMRTDLLSQRHTAGLRWSQSWLIGKAVPHLHLFSNREHQLSPTILRSQQILYLTTQHHSQWNCDIILVVCIPFRTCNSKTTSHVQFSILRPRCNINDTIYLINDTVL